MGPFGLGGDKPFAKWTTPSIIKRGGEGVLMMKSPSFLYLYPFLEYDLSNIYTFQTHPDSLPFVPTLTLPDDKRK
jgi:hypothetical protein